MLNSNEVETIAQTVSALTMVRRAGLEFAMNISVEMVDRGIEGDIVECGVWRGGCSIAMAIAQRFAFGSVRKRVHLFDSFQGLPKASIKDGPKAAAWQADTASPLYFDNCKASVRQLRRALNRHGIERDCTIWEGMFDDTLRSFKEPIALLRLDCDWYYSMLTCLNYLMPRVSVGGIVIIDDYYAWEGCARALHDYLSQQDLPYRIKSAPDAGSAYFMKEC